MTPRRLWLAGATMLALSGAAQAALVDRGGGMIYDTTLNITWLADMNYAKTSGYDDDGWMTWSEANTWANKLVYGGYDDWRLPTLNAGDTTCSQSWGYPTQYFGYNCTGGELSHLFVTDLGNKARQTVLTQTGDTAEQIANLALFSHVQSDYYWSGLEYTPGGAGAWGFDTSVGSQNAVGKRNVMYAVAVRPGDVASPVQEQLPLPEPQSLALALLGLAAAVAATKRLT